MSNSFSDKGVSRVIHDAFRCAFRPAISVPHLRPRHSSLVPSAGIAQSTIDRIRIVPTITLYGLSTCDTCRKARKWLDRFGVEYAFVDYRANPVPAAILKDWARQLGGWEKLVNKSSTTWRNLLPQRKNPGSDPEWTLLLKEYPALIRRPVVLDGDGGIGLGFSDNAFKKLFAK